MDKLAPTTNLHNLSLHPNSLSHKPKPPRTYLQSSLSFAPTSTSHEAAHLSTSPAPSLLPKIGSLDRWGDVNTLDTVKAMHAEMIKLPNKWDSDSVAKNLITCYLQVSDFRSAAVVFFVGLSRNYAMWKDFVEEIEGFGGDPREVLEVFKELHCKGVNFDSRVVTIILKICSKVVDCWLGLQVHASLIKRGFESDVHINCSLMNFYGKCWDVESANRVFHGVPGRGDLLWNEAILINLKNGDWDKAQELFRGGMQFSFGKASSNTISKMLQKCGKEGALNEGKQIHGYVVKHGLELNLFICNSLIAMYSSNGKLKLARNVFESMEDRSLSSWNSIISSYGRVGYLNDAWDLFIKMELSGVRPDLITWNCLLSSHALHGLYKETLLILQRMQVAGFRPNSSSITSALQAVTELKLVSSGREIHGYVLRNGLDYDVYVGTSLLDMYVKNDCLTSSQAVFDIMENKNIFAWNSLISGYSFKGLFNDANRLLNLMQEEGIKPDLVTWNSLVYGFSMHGQIEEALKVINKIKSSGLSPNVVSWTALISGCSQKGKYREAIDLFFQMQQEGMQPNSATISSLLRTCGGLALLQKGKEIHCLCTKNDLLKDVYIVTALIDMYSKSGDLGSAHEVFRKSRRKTLASWNCMIMGLAIYGYGREAIALFCEMQEQCILPDAITFTALLSGCKNAALVDEGWRYFDSMSRDYKIKPTIEHYCCMVDLLGRAGYLDEAWDFIQTMPLKPDATIWGAFFGSSRIHKNMEFAEIAARKLFELEPYNSANYVMLRSLYAMSNRWEDEEQIRDLMQEKGVKKGQVWSWIQIDHSVHVFSADKTHKDEGKIYYELYQLVSEIKKIGYVPDISYVQQNIDDVEKQKLLLSHTEKLAITYGLIKTTGSRPIRVIKNTRICSDCHTAAKLISLARKREICLKDGARFHHFNQGKCSCNDYW